MSAPIGGNIPSLDAFRLAAGIKLVSLSESPKFGDHEVVLGDKGAEGNRELRNELLSSLQSEGVPQDFIEQTRARLGLASEGDPAATKPLEDREVADILNNAEFAKTRADFIASQLAPEAFDRVEELAEQVAKGRVDESIDAQLGVILAKFDKLGKTGDALKQAAIDTFRATLESKARKMADQMHELLRLSVPEEYEETEQRLTLGMNFLDRIAAIIDEALTKDDFDISHYDLPEEPEFFRNFESWASPRLNPPPLEKTTVKSNVPTLVKAARQATVKRRAAQREQEIQDVKDAQFRKELLALLLGAAAKRVSKGEKGDEPKGAAATLYACVMKSLAEAREAYARKIRDMDAQGYRGRVAERRGVSESQVPR